VLDRALTNEGRYPPVEPLASLSRLASKVTSPEQAAAATAVRSALAAAASVRDLVEVGAYVPGTNPAADAGLALAPELRAFLTQRADDVSAYGDAWAALGGLAERAVAA